MTDDDRTAALAAALHARTYLSHGVPAETAACGYCESVAAAVLAAMPDWTLLPTAEVERLRAIEKAAWQWNERPSGFMEQRSLRAALAQGASDDG